ncbi:hypothetical protein ABTK20_21775, partial [Acinetobacter baumannii]
RQAGTVEIDGRGLSVYIASQDPPTTVDTLKALEIPPARGAVRLDEIATVETSQTPPSITTSRGLRTATVTVTPTTDNLSSSSA